MDLSLTSLETLGDRLRATRTARRLKPAIIAKRLGISRVSLNSWEKDQVKSPEINKLMEFTKFTDISLEWLVDGSGDLPDFVKPKSRRARDEMHVARREGFIEGWHAAMRFIRKAANTLPTEGSDK